jgi:hypothetical protein
MDRSMERRVSHRARTSRARWIPCPSHEFVSEDPHSLDVRSDIALRFSPPLPPTRAARPSRSRGVFLPTADPAPAKRRWRKTDLSIAALAVMVVAMASALVLGAPPAILGALGTYNPGPAIVGAASVPPAFVEPSATR